VRLWKVAGAVFKAETYRFLRLAAPTDEERAAGADWPAGFVHIPKGTTAEWVKQLTSEQLVTRKTRTGYQKLEWEQTRERNEALDCRVYARAAAWLMGIDRWDNLRWEALEEQIGPARPATTPAGQPDRPQPQSAPKRPTGWLGPRRGKWL
jgi:phage terminase large subunit GpA-like protein